ncbi:MAG: hypothetical protein AAGE88_25425 [Actinomycetota bacterium]
MSSLRTIELVSSVDQNHIRLVCDTDGPYWLGEAQHYGVGTWDVSGRKTGLVAGERFEAVTAAPRLVSVPILIEGATEQEVDVFLGTLGRMVNPQSGPCRIIHQRPDGYGREISAYYVQGGERVRVEHNGKRFVRVPLVFRAMDPPFWRPTARSDDLETAQFDDAYASGSNYVEIVNGGDVEVWPRFRFTPPVQNIEIASLNTGQVFRIIRKVFGEQIDIDTDPRGFQVLLNQADAFDALMDPNSEFFPLQPGVNRLIFRAAGQSSATIGDVGIYQMWWRILYDTP